MLMATQQRISLTSPNLAKFNLNDSKGTFSVIWSASNVNLLVAVLGIKSRSSLTFCKTPCCLAALPGLGLQIQKTNKQTKSFVFKKQCKLNFHLCILCVVVVGGMATER